MADFKMIVGPDCVLHIAPSSFPSIIAEQNLGSWELVLRDMSPPSPRIAGFVSKAIFPFTQYLSLSIGFLSNNQQNLSSVTKGRCNLTYTNSYQEGWEGTPLVTQRKLSSDLEEQDLPGLSVQVANPGLHQTPSP